MHSAHRRTAEDFEALEARSQHEIAQWVELTDKLTRELEFARAQVLELEQVTAGVAEAAALQDVDAVNAILRQQVPLE